MLTKIQLENLKSLGLEGIKNEEHARQVLTIYLNNQEIEDTEDDSLDELIEYSLAFYDDSDDPQENNVPEFFAYKENKKAKKPVVKKEKPVEETEEQLLAKVAQNLERENFDYDSMTTTELRQKFIKIQEELLEKANNADKNDLVKMLEFTKPMLGMKMSADILQEVRQRQVKKAKSTGKKRGARANGEKLEGRSNLEHEKLIKDFFNKQFGEENFVIKILKNGFTIRMKLENSLTPIMNFGEARVVEGKLLGNVYLNRFKTVEDLQPFLPETFEDKDVGMYRGEPHPSIKKLTQDEIKALINESEVFNESYKRAGGLDKILGKNKEKLQNMMK